MIPQIVNINYKIENWFLEVTLPSYYFSSKGVNSATSLQVTSHICSLALCHAKLCK